jgi:zinc D-Ala-D-Ala carboxypeptidase
MTLSIYERLHQLGIDHAAVEARGLHLHEEATADSLVTVAVGKNGRQYQLISEAAFAWQAMQSAAANEGHQLIVQSAYRSVARQCELIEAALKRGETITEILTSLAPPGYSEHHTGRAVDIASQEHPELAESFADTPAYAWLSTHAGQYGFRMSYPKGNADGYVYEPWHWCWQAEKV